MKVLFTGRYKILLLVILLQLSSYKLFSQIYLIGPTLHYNIGGGIKELSWGVEFSYWNWQVVPAILPVGFDVGVEFAKNRKKFYIEFQKGCITGISAGYVYEIGDTINRGGFQGSIWASYYGGIDLRIRRINKMNYCSPGLILKGPLYARFPRKPYSKIKY
jgi:hypothetical protein